MAMANLLDPIGVRIQVQTRGRDLDVKVDDYSVQRFVTVEVGPICFFFSSIDEVAQLMDGLNHAALLLEAMGN